MIILGIDPGTATTGFGIVKTDKNNQTIIDFGVISTDKKLSDSQRLKILGDDLAELIKKIFSLKQTPKPDDAADALAIVLCASHSFKNFSKLK